MPWNYDQVREFVKEHPKPIPELEPDPGEDEYREWLAQRREKLGMKPKEEG